MDRVMPNIQQKSPTSLSLKGLPTPFLAFLILLAFPPLSVARAANSPTDTETANIGNPDTFTGEGAGEFEYIEPALPIELAQVEETVSFFETPGYAVRVIRRPGIGLFMNAYNRATGIQEQNGVPTRVLSSNNGAITYASEGSRNGLPATYLARVNSNGVGELQIINSNGSIVLQETGTIANSNIPPEQFPPQEETTIIRFQGTDFATHVLEKGGSLFMNVYDRQAEVTVLNGQRAFIEAPRNENDEWRSYLSFGDYRGVPSTFTARVSPQGQTQLEITNRNNGQLLAREDSNLIEGQTTNLLTNDYVVAIPGGQDMLTSVRQFYPEAYLDRSRQGDFVNAGTFGNRNAAFARTYALQAQGINARVVYRRISYR